MNEIFLFIYRYQGFHQKTSDPSLLLLISTLSYKMCRNQPTECDGTVCCFTSFYYILANLDKKKDYLDPFFKNKITKGNSEVECFRKTFSHNFKIFSKCFKNFIFI